MASLSKMIYYIGNRLWTYMVHLLSTSKTKGAADHRQLEDLLLNFLSELNSIRDCEGPIPDELVTLCYTYSKKVNGIRLVWGCLKLFIEGTKKWSNAVDVVENCGSVIVKIEATADALAEVLSTRQEIDGVISLCFMMEEFEEVAREFSDPEICEVVCSILESVVSESENSTVRIHSPFNHLPPWTEYVRSTGKMINIFDPSSFPDLEELASFLYRVHQGFGSGLTSVSGDEKVKIEGFFAYVANMVFRVASLCWYCFFSSNDPGTKLTELAHNISFTNPKFLDSTIKFLSGLNNSCCSPTSVSQKDLVKVFLNSFIVQTNSKLRSLFCKDLKEMLIALINNPEDPINEEDKRDLAEIKQVVVEAIHALHFEYKEPGSALIVGREIWLRKVAMFLKQQLLCEKIFKHPAGETIDFLEICLNELENCGEANGHPAQTNVASAAEDSGMLTKQVPVELKSLYQSFCDEKIKEGMVRISILQLISKVALLRAKQTLMKFLNHHEIVIAHCKNELSFLLEYIKLFASTLANVKAENTVDEEKKLLLIESLSMRTLYFCYLSPTEKIAEEDIKEKVTQLLDEMQMVKKQLVLDIPNSNFPKLPPELGFLDRLLGSVLELCNCESNPFYKDQLENFQVELDSLRSCIRGASQERYDLLECKDLGSRVTKLIYESEHVINSIDVGIGAQWQHMLLINYLVREIACIKPLAATKLQEKRILHIPKKSSSSVREVKPETDKPMVRLDEDEEGKIINSLTRGPKQLNIVSIVGMAGLGKTTLAKRVYNDPKVSYYFHVRAWCFVSQAYEKRDLLLELLEEIRGLTDEIRERDDADLELKLKQSLKEKRYLIVMDDVWDDGAWNALQNSFPDDRNGSRVMITSSMHKLPLHGPSSTSTVHPLRKLSAEESWKLLEMRIFHKEGCPEELVETGKGISKKCDGLPLAVVAVAGILEKTDKKHESWQQILRELNTRVIADPVTQCKSILEMSYNHLPTHLKACFLYFGAFQQDREVQVKKLIQMWIAEGFIQNDEQKSLEEKGEDFLVELIDRSLVMVSKKKSRGGVKTCQIQSLLRDLCGSKSEKENFLQRITSDCEPYPLFRDLYDGVDFDNDDPSRIAKYESYRVCTYLKRKHFVYSRPSGPWTRSLIFTAFNDANPRRTYDLSFIWENFKFLMVLDLESINLGVSFPTTIQVLVLMRYLALSGDLNSIPESISNLRKLETFIVKGLGGKVELPDTFWSMTSLRHVHVKNQAAFNLLGNEFGSSILLDNLVTFSCPSLSYAEDADKILSKLPNLLKLRCIFLESRDSSGNCNPFPRFDSLKHLESLNILYAGRDRNPGEFNLPLNLQKLTLSRFRLSWNHMSTIGGLPNLQVLKLLNGSLEGLTWDMKDDEFQKLKFLKLDSMNIVQWNASSGHLPELEQLVLWNCVDLVDVPYDFFGIATLQIIEVQRCSESVEKSVKDIQQEMERLQSVHLSLILN